VAEQKIVPAGCGWPQYGHVFPVISVASSGQGYRRSPIADRHERGAAARERRETAARTESSEADTPVPVPSRTRVALREARSRLGSRVRSCAPISASSLPAARRTTARFIPVPFAVTPRSVVKNWLNRATSVTMILGHCDLRPGESVPCRSVQPVSAAARAHRKRTRITPSSARTSGGV
jgi:hypothetical protein